MTPAFFTRISIQGVLLADLIGEYQDWAVGEGEFERLRRGRESVGLSRTLTADALDVSGDFPGSSDFEISVRHGDGRSLLRLNHQDADDGSIRWHNIVRLTGTLSGATIEHSISRTAPRGVVLAPRAAAPAVIKDLIDIHGGGGISPKDLYKAQLNCGTAAEAEAFTSHVLLDTRRDAPLLVVTPSVRTNATSVTAELLAKSLRGSAMIAQLTSREACEAMTVELMRAGFDRQFACFDGGVRLYNPRLTSKDALHQHPLWIRSWLDGLGATPRMRARGSLELSPAVWPRC